MPVRSSDVVEVHGEKAITFGIGGVIALLIATVLYIFRGDGMMMGFIWILGLGGVAAIGYAVYCATRIKKVDHVHVVCVYCEADNQLTDEPSEDFLCASCNRMIPVLEGKIIPVFQVRCGYCNSLNYYSAKTEVLLCEECNREIPIAVEDGKPTKHLPKGFAVTDDDNLYELVLVADGHKHEELIASLQHMLALNRNQVKQMLDDLPVTLLTGITRKKAEMLQAQLAASDGTAEFRPLPTSVG